MGKLVNEGESDVLTKWIKDSYVTLYLGLYTNTTEPAETADLASLTEPSGFGYARIALASADWSIASAVNDVIENLQKTFTASGGTWGNCYGYFIGTTVDNTGLLLFVEHFSNGPYDVTDGSSVKITPSITAA